RSGGARPQRSAIRLHGEARRERGPPGRGPRREPVRLALRAPRHRDRGRPAVHHRVRAARGRRRVREVPAQRKPRHRRALPHRVRVRHRPHGVGLRRSAGRSPAQVGAVPRRRAHVRLLRHPRAGESGLGHEPRRQPRVADRGLRHTPRVAEGAVMTRARSRRAALAATLLMAFTAPSHAGDPSVEPYRTQTERGSSGYSAYAEIGQAALGESPPSTQVGFRVASVKPGVPSVDFAMAAWLVPAAVVTPDLDLALPFAVTPDVRIAPRAGVSGVLVGGGDLIFVAAGVNVGLGIVLTPRGPVSLRGDYTLRTFMSPEADESELMHVLSAGISWGGSK